MPAKAEVQRNSSHQENQHTSIKYPPRKFENVVYNTAREHRMFITEKAYMGIPLPKSFNFSLSRDFLLWRLTWKDTRESSPKSDNQITKSV